MYQAIRQASIAFAKLFTTVLFSFSILSEDMPLEIARSSAISRSQSDGLAGAQARAYAGEPSNKSERGAWATYVDTRSGS